MNPYYFYQFDKECVYCQKKYLDTFQNLEAGCK